MRRPQCADTCRVLFPLHFFTSGGIYSGMILFFLTGLALSAMLLRGKFGGIVFVLSLLVMCACVVVSVHCPQLVQPMTQRQHRDNMISTLVLAGMALYSTILLILRAYVLERAQNRELMERLRSLSVMDSLSGLYNRRELFRRLEVMYGGEHSERSETLTCRGHNIAMFDADNFKALNDTYGHSFGDEVLVSISDVLRGMVRPEAGELTARYGGEEFVSILTASDMEEARARIEEARRQIEALRWESNPSVRVSVSCGLISCEKHLDLTNAMHDVDELLYAAKAAGKNRVFCG